ncbi:MAG TPA: hypothetical protein VJZ00_07475 [Thermoanaerobaculia bacterium]|nr:hypothetical protein [Thermoanaerobaculia bacterium]
MIRRKSRRLGSVDGGEGRGIPLGGRDDRPHAGYRAFDDDDIDVIDRDLFLDSDEDAERRRDPLRR